MLNQNEDVVHSDGQCQKGHDLDDDEGHGHLGVAEYAQGHDHRAHHEQYAREADCHLAVDLRKERVALQRCTLSRRPPNLTHLGENILLFFPL